MAMSEERMMEKIENLRAQVSALREENATLKAELRRSTRKSSKISALARKLRNVVSQLDEGEEDAPVKNVKKRNEEAPSKKMRTGKPVVKKSRAEDYDEDEAPRKKKVVKTAGAVPRKKVRPQFNDDDDDAVPAKKSVKIKPKKSADEAPRKKKNVSRKMNSLDDDYLD